jgi:2-dehydro-3-deoxyglucarate aldolase/4-hydroxy-2-oxoheptanedioate aldolase
MGMQVDDRHAGGHYIMHSTEPDGEEPMAGTMKQRLHNGERLVMFAVGRMFNPNIVRYLGMTGDFDGFWIDVEHGGLTTSDIEIASTAGQAHGLECFVRVPPTDYATVTRCFESGATGVMAAQIRSAEQTEEFVQWAKFAPRGRRGLNPLSFDGRYGTIPLSEFTEAANRETFVAIQIETAQAVDEVDGIAAVDGVDLLFVGPSDLSQALGSIGDFMGHASLQAVDRVAAACRAHGKQWGAVTPNPEYAAMLVDKGCTLISVINDVKLVTEGLAATKEKYSLLW